jgi:hypothetical protein
LLDGVVGAVAAGGVGAVVLAVEPVETARIVPPERGVMLVDLRGCVIPDGSVASVDRTGAQLAGRCRGAMGVVSAGGEVVGDGGAGPVEFGGPARTVGSLSVEVPSPGAELADLGAQFLEAALAV